MDSRGEIIESHAGRPNKERRMASIAQIIVLAIIQGLAELLPVSSSAHVVVAEKLMHLRPGSPQMMLLLVMLHTGTMFAVIVYFWNTWKKTLFGSVDIFKEQATRLIVATVLTLAIGVPLIWGIEKAAAHSGFVTPGPDGKVDVEQLSENLGVVAAALAAAGVLILIAGVMESKDADKGPLTLRTASAMGVVQAICLPFRGFSRSGATISTGMLAGAGKRRVEEFSFALAVLITPAAIGREVLRVIKHRHELGAAGHLSIGMFGPSILGMFFAFLAGLVALKWLSSWLENGKWYWFGVYCLGFAVVVSALYVRGI
jgi:undecaprenyl-diphosphatase